jgi:hypothetical protein
MPTPPAKKKASEPKPEVQEEKEFSTEEIENPMVVETIDDPDAEVPVIDNSVEVDPSFAQPTVIETIDDPDAEVPIIDNSEPPEETPAEKEKVE